MIPTTPSFTALSVRSSISARCHLAALVTVLACICVLTAFTASAQAATASLYVTNSFGFGHPDRLTGYSAGAADNTAPLTNLVGTVTGLNGPAGRAVAG
jgi:hypothetical protein